MTSTSQDGGGAAGTLGVTGPHVARRSSERPAKSSRVPRLVAVGLLLALAGFFGLRYLRSKGPPPVKFETASVDRGPISAKVTATGTLSALVTVLVGSQVSGRIETIRVDYNSVVKKGQVVATIEPSLFQAAMEQARANYISAKADLDKAKAQSMDADRQFARSKTLAEQKLIAQADLDTAEANARVAKAQVAAAEAGVEQAHAALHQAEVNLKYTTILSPIDGVVISKSVDVGQTVAASLQAPTLFTIAQDLTKMQVDTSVAEGDVGKIREGMPVTFTVDAYPTERFDGTVRQVRDVPTTVQNVVTYDAVIDVDNSRRLLKPGMTANVTFVHASKDDVVRIPNAALRFRPDAATLALLGVHVPTVALKKTERQLWVLRRGKPSPEVVRIGISDGALTELVEGHVAPGDLAITESIGGKPATGRPPF
jgi:HlyD family secretion protein